MEFRTGLPKTMVGKVLRRALREEEEAKLAAKAKRPAPEKQAAQSEAGQA